MKTVNRLISKYVSFYKVRNILEDSPPQRRYTMGNNKGEANWFHPQNHECRKDVKK